jgi:hypothetical protein
MYSLTGVCVEKAVDEKHCKRTQIKNKQNNCREILMEKTISKRRVRIRMSHTHIVTSSKNIMVCELRPLILYTAIC